MLKRKMYKTLLDWKSSDAKVPLVIKGARQIGKTFIVREFGENEYESFIEINFLETPEYIDIFANDLSAKSIYAKMALFDPSYQFVEGKTLIFLDEIQACPNARAALKFLSIDGRYDIISSGSLLGISFKEVPSIPVGYEEQVFMYPLDFEEYLWAKGYKEEHIQALKANYESKEPITGAINDIFLNLVREYIVVGGMPEVVANYLKNNDLEKVYRLQNRILNSYYDDISRYAFPYEQPKIKKIYQSIPDQLAKENKKFQYSVVEKGTSARKFGNSLDWLINAGLLYPCKNLATLTFPIKDYEKNDVFKIYMSDVGLLTALYGLDIKRAIINDSLSGSMKGGIYENFIATQLMIKHQRLNYYRSQNSDLEIEFIIEHNLNVVPIEVKAKNGSTRSLDNILKADNIPFGYKLVFGNCGIKGKKITLPLYFVMFL